MDTGNDLHPRNIAALRTQANTEYSSSGSPVLSHQGCKLPNVDQSNDHAKTNHMQTLSPNGPFEDSSTPGLTSLFLKPPTTHRSSPPSGRKRPAESDSRRGKLAEVFDSDLSRNIPHSTAPGRIPEKLVGIRLFDPREAPEGKKAPQRPLPHRSAPRSQCSQGRPPGLIELQRYDPRYPGLLLQPDSRPISQEHLASEVKSIYAGLTMVETKCIHVDRAQAAATQDNPEHKLASDHWQALIALHRTLLHEHHDFFLASQHPSASPALRRLAAKYSMPARMWKHGVHSFLELLRRRLTDSIDYMLAFIYLAYQMMALLYETVPAFEDTWIECLGDLGRYRMAIEDEDIRDRETWAGVARSWYAKAADKTPAVGCLYHHLAILSQPKIQRWWQSISIELCRTIKRLEQEGQGLPNQFFRLVSKSPKIHKFVIATCLCAINIPLASAANDLKPDATTPIQTRTPIFKFETPFDYTILGLMLLYLLGALSLRVATRYYSQALHFSYGLMIAMGGFSFVVNRDEFADYIRTTVFAIWFTATLHTGAQYCYDNYNPTLHLVSILIAAIVSVLVKIMWPTLSLLDMIPPSLSLIAPLTALTIREISKHATQRPLPDDEEHNNSAIALEDRDATQYQGTGVHTGQQSSAPEQLVRRNSSSLRNSNATLPDPSNFIIGDDPSDTASARRDFHATHLHH